MRVRSVSGVQLCALLMLILAVRLDASRYTSSPLPEAISSVPLVAPSAIVITPRSVLIVVTPCEALLSVAVKAGSEGRRVGEEGRSRGAPEPLKKKGTVAG